MSASDVPPRDPWDLVEDLLAEQEAERLEKLSPEQLLEEMKKAGVEPGRVDSLVDRALGAAERQAPPAPAAEAPAKPAEPPREAAKVVSLQKARERRGRTTMWALFAAAAGVAAVVYTNRETVVAWFEPSPTPTPTVPMPMSAPTGPAPEQLALAKTLRQQAFDQCSRQYYSECEELLDKARALDPAGEKDDLVHWMRASIDRSRHPERYVAEAGAGDRADAAPFFDTKPPLGLGERPLRKHHAADAGSGSPQ